MSHEPKEVRSKRWRLAWGVAGLLLLLLVCLLYASTLQPVRVGILESILRRATGAHIQLAEIRLQGNTAALGRLAVRDTSSAPPLLQAEEVRLSHRWNPFAARPLRDLSAASIHLHLAAADPALTNYEFVLRRLAQPGKAGGGSLAPIPERFRVANLCVRVERPTLQFSLEGIDATAEIDSLQQFSMAATSTDTHLTWITPGSEGMVSGQLDLSASVSDEEFALRGHISLTDAIELNLHAAATQAGNAPFEVGVQDAVLHESFWPQLLSDFLPVPVYFNELRIESGDAIGTRKPHLTLDSGHALIHTRGLRFGAEDLPEGTPEAGTVEVTARQEGSRITLSASAMLPGVLTLESSGAVTPGEEATSFDLSFETLETDSPGLLAWLTARVPYPLQAERLRASGFQAQGLWRNNALVLEPLMLDLTLSNAVVGDPELPWYVGALRVQGTVEAGEQQRFEGNVHLDAGDPATVRVVRTAPEIDLQVELPGWTRSAIAQNLPPRLEPILERLPGIERVAGPVHVTGKDGAYRIASELATNLRGMPQPMRIGIQGTANTDTAPLFSGQVHAADSGASVRAQVQFTSPEQFEVEALLDQVGMGPWVRAWTGLQFPEELAATASGRTTLRTAGNSYAITLDNTFPGLKFGGLALPDDETASAQGPLSLRQDFETLDIGPLKLQLGEGLSGTLTQGKFRLSPLSGAFSVEDAETDLLWLGTRFGVSDLYGNARFSGSVTLEGAESITANLKVASDSMGYGNWATPYGVPLSVDGTIQYFPGSGALEGALLQAHLGDATSASAARLEVRPAPAGEATAMAFEQIEISTDLMPAVALELLGGASGIQAHFSLAHVRRAGTGWSLQVTPRVEGESLALPKDLARLEDLSFQGDFTYANNNLQGAGTLRAARLVTGGVTAHGMDTQVRGEGQEIFLEQFESTLFDGTVRGRLRAGIAVEGMPVELELEIENIDLATFTREFNPPEIKLTGRASGTVRVVFNHEGIQDFEAKLLSEEGFTLNRDMLLLMAEYMEQNVSSSRQIQRGLTQVIGQMEQRPFDRAELDLGFENNLILGVLRLKSRALDFNINVDSDPESLIEALRVRQGG